MDLFEHVDIYCERLDTAFWAEPVNAVTNASFIIAAAVIWGILGGKEDRGARILTINLFLIGVGSFLFHTFAQTWAEHADVLPIMTFILIYLFLTTTRVFALPNWAGGITVAAFFPYSYGAAMLIGKVTGPLNGSIAYVPVFLLLVLMALAAWPRDTGTARGLVIGAGLLALSLFFRSIDEAVCNSFPLGTHFLWHTLNGILLGWLILVLHRHQAHPR